MLKGNPIWYAVQCGPLETARKARNILVCLQYYMNKDVCRIKPQNRISVKKTVHPSMTLIKNTTYTLILPFFLFPIDSYNFRSICAACYSDLALALSDHVLPCVAEQLSCTRPRDHIY